MVPWICYFCFLKYIFDHWEGCLANSFRDHIKPRVINFFGNMFPTVKTVKILFWNIYSLKSNCYFQGTVMSVQCGFLFLILPRHSVEVSGGCCGVRTISAPSSGKWPSVSTCMRKPLRIPTPPPLFPPTRRKTGRNHLIQEITPLFPTVIVERYSHLPNQI